MELNNGYFSKYSFTTPRLYLFLTFIAKYSFPVILVSIHNFTPKNSAISINTGKKLSFVLLSYNPCLIINLQVNFFLLVIFPGFPISFITHPTLNEAYPSKNPANQASCTIYCLFTGYFWIFKPFLRFNQSIKPLNNANLGVRQWEFINCTITLKLLTVSITKIHLSLLWSRIFPNPRRSVNLTAKA
uniref:Uncharacterized protein n=1 Tax=Ophiocordycipitaceae sp. TaxID=1907519 RepID=A0A7S8CTU4_9HYPO|nr:hypothetical protein [Ophiocordycipitaceae sp.]QUT09498.1 hypothetical protein [Ophiocordycipitaceae sp.]QUT09526.1 hypothetical protein [Ophiocordycipitaceae sp.]QUT13256.1 hypothetical protein [Ophiocordycipitaceae sp.]DAJ12193.1 TPA_asm: hypothetical protein [Ophiocordycipitaceae sp.]